MPSPCSGRTNARGDKPLTPEQQAYVQSVATQQAASYIAAVATQQAEAPNVAAPPAAPAERVNAPASVAPSAPPAAPVAPSVPSAPPPPPPAQNPPAAAPPTIAPPPPPPTVAPPRPVPSLTRDDLIAYFGGAGEAYCIADAMLFHFTLDEIAQMGIDKAADAIPADIDHCIQKFKPDGLPPQPLPTSDPYGCLPC